MRIRQPESYESIQQHMKEQADRRTLLRTGAGIAIGAASLAGGAGLAMAQDDSTPEVDATPEVCVLTPELTEGPYYFPEHLVRKDITEGRAGVPLKLRIGVLNPANCSAVEQVAVDIWHCDALGYYSGAAANAPGDGDPVPDDLETIPEDNFLRGVQITDADGYVEFDTIYPGWYAGRAIHIHMKVHVGGTIDEGDATEGDETLVGDHTVHTGQLFFGEDMNDLVFANPPYNSRVTTRLANANDRILGNHDEEPGFMLNLSLIDEDDVTAGLEGTILVGVDPDRG